MKGATRTLILLVVVGLLAGAHSSLQAVGICNTGLGGPAPYCGEAGRTESCPTGQGLRSPYPRSRVNRLQL